MKMKRRRIVYRTFNGCVNSLERLANKLNITYEELKVVIFIVG